jgi:hypothetical protein
MTGGEGGIEVPVVEREVRGWLSIGMSLVFRSHFSFRAIERIHGPPNTLKSVKTSSKVEANREQFFVGANFEFPRRRIQLDTKLFYFSGARAKPLPRRTCQYRGRKYPCRWVGGKISEARDDLKERAEGLSSPDRRLCSVLMLT